MVWLMKCLMLLGLLAMLLLDLRIGDRLLCLRPLLWQHPLLAL